MAKEEKQTGRELCVCGGGVRLTQICTPKFNTLGALGSGDERWPLHLQSLRGFPEGIQKK